VDTANIEYSKWYELSYKFIQTKGKARKLKNPSD
jgi:hypothetical protein